MRSVFDFFSNLDWIGCEISKELVSGIVLQSSSLDWGVFDPIPVIDLVMMPFVAGATVRRLLMLLLWLL